MSSALSIAWAVALLLFSVMVFDVFGSGRLPSCPFCGTRFKEHEADCPWKSREQP
jgi:hypothetical protein